MTPLEMRSPNDCAVHSGFPGGSIFRLAISTTSSSLSALQQAFKLFWKPVVCWLHKPNDVLSLVCPAPGLVGQAFPKHGSSRHLTASCAKLCSISSNTACWTLPRLVGNSKCSIKMSWSSVSKGRGIGVDRSRESSGESL